MTKRDFLEKLRLSLSGRVSAEVVTDNISYYEDYINTEIRKGKREDEVLEALGDPRLIARTIAETNPLPAGGRSSVYADEEQGRAEGEHARMPSGSFLARLPLWAWLVLAVVVAVLVVSAVFSILSAVLPILLPLLLVLLLVKFFRDWME